MIKAIRTLAGIILFVALLVYSLAFATSNSETLTLDFMLGGGFELPVSVWLLVFFVVGALLGSLVSGLLSAWRGSKIRRLNRDLNDMREKLAKLK
ncbi:MAG: lipopolysaccharide assembly protein LapA domain-containing protein [Oceanobacter sp.]